MQRLAEGLRADGRGGVHRAAQGCLGGQHLPQAATRPGARRGHDQAGVRAGVGGEHARAAAVGHDGHRVARRYRLGRHQHGHVQQLAEAGRGDDARLLEQRLPDNRRRGGRRGMRGGGTLTRSRPPGMDGQHRKLSAHPARGPREPARVAERLQVEKGQFGCVVSLPPQQHVGT